MAYYAGIPKFSMQRVIMDNLQKTVSTGSFRIFKAENSGDRQVDVMGNRVSHQHDLHLPDKKMSTVEAVTNKQKDRVMPLALETHQSRSEANLDA